MCPTLSHNLIGLVVSFHNRICPRSLFKETALRRWGDVFFPFFPPFLFNFYFNPYAAPLQAAVAASWWQTHMNIQRRGPSRGSKTMDDALERAASRLTVNWYFLIAFVIKVSTAIYYFGFRGGNELHGIEPLVNFPTQTRWNKINKI